MKKYITKRKLNLRELKIELISKQRTDFIVAGLRKSSTLYDKI